MSRLPLALMGGAFDPVHYGHLRTAVELRAAVGFDSLILLPTGHPPHRQPAVAAPAVRVEMLRAATQDLPWCAIDERELRRPGPSYTVDTLAELRQEWPTRSLCLILGMDAFCNLPEWHRWNELTTLAHVLVARRPGFAAQVPAAMQDWHRQHEAHSVRDLHTLPAGRIWIQTVTALDISSSSIRQQLSRGLDPRYLLPDAALAIARRCLAYTGEAPVAATAAPENR